MMLKNMLAAAMLAGLGALCAACGGQGRTESAETGTAPQPQHDCRPFHIYNTGGLGVHVRDRPSVHGESYGKLADGTPVRVCCQEKDESVSDGKHSSSVWDALDSGGWVSDLYVDTPVVGDYSPGLAFCGE